MNALVLAASWFEAGQEFADDPRYPQKNWYVNQYVKHDGDTRRITLFDNLTRAQARKIVDDLTAASKRVRTVATRFKNFIYK